MTVTTSLLYRFGRDNHLERLVRSGNVNAKAALTACIAIYFPLGFGRKISPGLAP